MLGSRPAGPCRWWWLSGVKWPLLFRPPLAWPVCRAQAARPAGGHQPPESPKGQPGKWPCPHTPISGDGCWEQAWGGWGEEDGRAPHPERSCRCCCHRLQAVRGCLIGKTACCLLTQGCKMSPGGVGRSEVWEGFGFTKEHLAWWAQGGFAGVLFPARQRERAAARRWPSCASPGLAVPWLPGWGRWAHGSPRPAVLGLQGGLAGGCGSALPRRCQGCPSPGAPAEQGLGPTPRCPSRCPRRGPHHHGVAVGTPCPLTHWWQCPDHRLFRPPGCGQPSQCPASKNGI